jgi:DNA polymerase delta subunit 1
MMCVLDIECHSRTGEFPVPTRGDCMRLAGLLQEDLLKDAAATHRAERHVQQCSDPGSSAATDWGGALRQLTESLLEDARATQPRALSQALAAAAGASSTAQGETAANTLVRAPLSMSAAELEVKAARALGIVGACSPRLKQVVAEFIRSRHAVSTDAIAQRLRALVRAGRLPHLRGDRVIQIGLVFRRYASPEQERVVLCLRQTAPPANSTRCRCFDTEAELLEAFRQEVCRRDPDVVLGYNIVGFDMAYLHARAVECGQETQLMRLGRLAGRSCALVERSLSSSALGDNLLRYIDMPGRVIVDIMKVVQRDHKLDSYKLDDVAHHFVKSQKLDVSPQDIFRLYQGSAQDRGRVAEYCLQDCVLCDQLCERLQVMANNMAMANVCSVPLTYIFMRGQGVKIFSLVAKHCMQNGLVIPQRQQPPPPLQQSGCGSEDAAGYEGAIVLDPEPGLYLEDPVSVLDYASLYPSCMISENLSHDMLVLDVPTWGQVPGVTYNRISPDGHRHCLFATATSGGQRGVIPCILQALLAMRKATRRRMALTAVTLTETDAARACYASHEGGRCWRVTPADPQTGRDTGPTRTVELPGPPRDWWDESQKAVLDGVQLAYKLTANSLYGQLGARTSPLFCKDIAACTTAVGRDLILKAKTFIETARPGARVIYGDTDSVMVVFRPHHQDDDAKGRGAIMESIRTAQHVSREFRAVLKPPHDLEYEKTYWPFLIFSKKRYVGNMYTTDDRQCKQVSMGTVSKRRDNAPIVKKVFDGILHRILDKQDVVGSIRFLHRQLHLLARGDLPLEDLVITKSLRERYKNPESVAHKVLADRMARRDPGSAPRANERIPYVYVLTPGTTHKKKDVLQGERIEHLDYVRQHALRPDHEFYITNQIMKPVCKLYSVMLDRLPRTARSVPSHLQRDPEAVAQHLLFADLLQQLCRRQSTIHSFFKLRSEDPN